MSRIDPSRISEIVKALRSARVRGTPKKTKSTDNAQLSKGEAASVVESKRNIAELQERIARQIRNARSRSPEISDETVSLVAIQEIMHWEFGDDILNHPDFKNISTTIVSRIHESSEMAKQFMDVLEDL